MPDQGSLKFITLYRIQSDGPFTPDRSQIAALAFFPVSEIGGGAAAGQYGVHPVLLHLLDFYAGSHGQPATPP